MCPTGADHPGHDREGVKKRGLHSSRGPNMTIGLKNSRPTMTACMALNWIRDLSGGGAARRRRSYDDNYANSEDDDYEGPRGLIRRGDAQMMLREKEEILVERALERINRARALGKTNVKLDPSEIEALQRAGVIARPPPPPAAVPKAAPKGKRPAQPKPKAVEQKKNGRNAKSTSNSPKMKAIEGRSRGRSTASNRSKNDSKDDAVVPYPALPDDRYPYPQGYYRASAPASRQQSQARTNSSQSLRQHPQAIPSYQHPYYQYRYYSNPDMYGPRPGSNSSRASRPDPTDPDWEPRARSSSNLVPYPLEQLPQAGGAGKAPRFDPSDPRFASPPTRRIVSGPPVAQYRKPQDELFLPEVEEPEVLQYLTNSSHEDDEEDDDDHEDDDSDQSGEGVPVDVNVEERAGGGYEIQTRAAAAGKATAGNGKGAKKRR